MPTQTIAKVEGPLPWTHKASGSVNHDFKLRFEGLDDRFVITQKPTSAPPQVGQQLDVEMLGPHPMHDGFTKVKRAQQPFPPGQGSFAPRNGVPAHDDATRRSIERQTSMRAATDLYHGTGHDPAEVVRAADIFWNWVSQT